MTQEVAKAVETAAEVAAPVASEIIPAGTIDYKKVALYAGIGVAVAGCGYLTYRLIKKRKAEKTEVIEINPADTTEEKADDSPAEK